MACALAVALAACGSGEEPAAGASTAGAAEASSSGPEHAIDPATVGKLSGVVRFAGAPPERAPLAIGSAAGCHHDNPPLSEAVIVENGGLRNVFVYVKRGLSGVEIPGPPPEPVTLDQRGCMYVPHVVGVRVGQELRVLNSDPARHNVHFFSERSQNPSFNQDQPAGAAPIPARFRATEIGARAGCDLHPWMSSWISAVDHPFFAVTGEGGRFEIAGLPPGAYTLEIWHEVFGRQTLDVALAEREQKEVAFDVRPR